MRPVIFHPKARDAIREFPTAVRYLLGRSLYRLQVGESLGMPHSRPMPVVARGVSELRVRGEDGIYRVFYCTASEQGILVVHAFVKKTQQTPASEIAAGRKQLEELRNA